VLNYEGERSAVITTANEACDELAEIYNAAGTRTGRLPLGAKAVQMLDCSMRDSLGKSAFTALAVAAVVVAACSGYVRSQEPTKLRFLGPGSRHPSYVIHRVWKAVPRGSANGNMI